MSYERKAGTVQTQAYNQTIAHDQLPIVAGITINTDEHGRFNLNALHRASGGEKRHSPSYWLALDSTQQLIAELHVQNTEIPVFTVQGRNGGTFVNDLLALDYGAWISPPFKVEVYRAFIDCRGSKPIQSAVPRTLSEALRLAADLYEQNGQLKVDSQALYRLTDSEGSYTPTAAAKTLQIKPKQLFSWLNSNRWIYRSGSGDWLGYASRIGSHHLTNKIRVITLDDGRQKTVQQLIITTKGLALIAKKLEAEHASD